MNEIIIPNTHEADKALQLVDRLADDICESQLTMQKNFVRIGQALLDVETKQHWIQRSFPDDTEDVDVPCRSFARYLKSVGTRANRKRTQLYHCLGVAKDLLPLIPETDLVTMGITKATMLRKMVTAGHTPFPKLIEAAKSKTVTAGQLMARIATDTGLYLPKEEEGKAWRELGLLRLDDAEAATFLSTISLAARGGDTQIEMNTWQDWTDLSPEMKTDLLSRIFAEFIATYSALYPAKEGDN